MTVGHAQVPDAQEVEDRRGQRVFVGVRQQTAVAVASATATAAATFVETRWPTVGTSGHRSFAPPSAPPSAATPPSRVGTV